MRHHLCKNATSVWSKRDLCELVLHFRWEWVWKPGLERSPACTWVFVGRLSNADAGSTEVTLKMAVVCGRGGAGRDGDVFTGGGWFGAEGPLTALFSALWQRKDFPSLNCTIFSYYNSSQPNKWLNSHLSFSIGFLLLKSSRPSRVFLLMETIRAAPSKVRRTTRTLTVTFLLSEHIGSTETYSHNSKWEGIVIIYIWILFVHTGNLCIPIFFLKVKQIILIKGDWLFYFLWLKLYVYMYNTCTSHVPSINHQIFSIICYLLCCLLQLRHSYWMSLL